MPRIIDADTHLIETAAIWEHMTEKERVHRPQAIELDEGIMVPPIQAPMTSVWVIDGQLYARTNLEMIEEFSGGEVKPGALGMTDPDERLKAMDLQGVDMHVIFPSLFLVLAPESPAVELALSRAYNRFLADRCSGSNGRLRWVMQPSLKNLDETLKAIAWCKERGAVGIHLRGLEGNRPVDHPGFYPIYRVAEDLDLPICVHIGNASPAFRQIRRNTEDRPSRFHMSVPTLMSFTAIATSEISTVFPKLRFGFFEIGSSWLTYLVVQAHKVRDHRDRRAFTQSVMRERNLYVTCEEHEELPLILQYAGDANLVLGSDYGHPGDVDESIFVQRKFLARQDVADEQKKRILSDNARTLFGLA
ncbi:MAG: amidohydrolase family protein [Gammaproteobacteria bacterium]|nr:amidohydrolase family protein [Gammaproteobacteria bacterium]